MDNSNDELARMVVLLSRLLRLLVLIGAGAFAFYVVKFLEKF